MLILLLIIPAVTAIGFTQSTAVEGILMCEEKPASGVLVKLFEHDKLTPDELMDSAKTDDDGKFHLSGTADEISSIEPKLVIFHDCNDFLKVFWSISLLFSPQTLALSTETNGLHSISLCSEDETAGEALQLRCSAAGWEV